MRYRYTVELTVDELDFSATEAEHLRAALREAAEEYATGEVKVLCEDGWCIEKNDARIRAALLGMRQRGTIKERLLKSYMKSKRYQRIVQPVCMAEVLDAATPM